MTPHLDSHCTTDPKPAMPSAVLTGNRIPRDGTKCTRHCACAYVYKRQDLRQGQLNHSGVGGGWLWDSGPNHIPACRSEFSSGSEFHLALEPKVLHLESTSPTHPASRIIVFLKSRETVRQRVELWYMTNYTLALYVPDCSSVVCRNIWIIEVFLLCWGSCLHSYILSLFNI